MSTYQWTDQKSAEAERATRTAMDQPGVTISLAADVPTDHEWWDGDRIQWSAEPALAVFDPWHPIFHRPKAGAR